PEEAWLQQEARAVRGKLALVNTIVEKARAAATAERWDEAIEQWNSLRGLYANYPGLDRELESLTARKQEARAALRARYVQQIREQMASCDYSPAAGLAQRASRDFAGDAELQTLREQIDVAQRAVEDARAAAAKQAFAPAARILETALGRYAGDPLLEREREAIERQAAAREAGITEAMRQSGELADEQDLDDALQTLDAAAQQYGEDPRLADLRRRVQAMRQAREVRSRDLDALNRLQDDARNLTSSAAISGLRQKVRSIAARYAEDVEFARTAAAVERQLEAMQQAGVLLAR